MVSKKSGQETTATNTEGDRRVTIQGHEVVFPKDERRKRIFIDGRPIHYGIAGDEYYLDVYAYDRAASLEEVVKRYLKYKGRTATVQKREE